MIRHASREEDVIAPVVHIRPIRLASFLAWWTRELAGLLPMRLRARWTTPCPTVVARGRDAFAIEPPSLKSDGSLPASDREQMVAALGRLGKSGGSVKLVVDHSLCLVRTTRIPAAGLGRAGEIVALDIERATPFQRTDVCFGWRTVRREPRKPFVTCLHAVVKLNFLSPIVEVLHSAGFARVFAACRLADGSEIAITLPADLARNNSRILRTLRFANWACAGMALTALSGALWTILERQHEALRRLDDQIASAQVQAVEVRTTYDKARALADLMAAFAAQRTEKAGVANVLAEITRILPDDTWLTDLHIKRDQIAIAGFGNSAPRLIAMIDASHLFEAVAFASPVVRAPVEGADRFNISFRLVASAAPRVEGGS